MWHYVRNNQKYGPVDDAAILNLIANGTIIRHTPVWREGMSEWVEACQTELKDKFSGIPPAPPSYMGLTKCSAPVVSYTPASIRNLWSWFLRLSIAQLILFVVWVVPLKAVNLGVQSCFSIVVLYGVVASAAGVVMMVLLYRFWSLIQDGNARTSPGKAVGFCFIPLFNLYWYYVVYVDLAKDMNRYCQERKISGVGANEKLVLAWYWISLAGGPVCFFASSLMMPIAFMTAIVVVLIVIMKQFADVGIGILSARQVINAAPQT